MRLLTGIAAAVFCIGAATVLQSETLPSGWQISAPQGVHAAVGTMPQGLAISPDGTKLAVVESGFTPPALRVLGIPGLQALRVVPLAGAFGFPVWEGSHRVLVAGANSDAVAEIDVDNGRVLTSWNGGHWPAAVAANDTTLAMASDGDATLVLNTRSGGEIQSIRVGAHPSAVLIARSGVIFVADRGEAAVDAIDGTHHTRIAVDLHPSALAQSPNGRTLYVACGDADTIDVVDEQHQTVVDRIEVGLPQGPGASPNALAVASDGTLYVSLGAENAIAEIKGNRVVARVPAGWYPTGVAVDAKQVYVINGKGDGSHANPGLDSNAGGSDPQYVGRLLTGSIRVIARTSFGATSTAAVLADVPAPQPSPVQTVVRAHGPIEHVIYIIKENRTYDQILGDLSGADGDPALAHFGGEITPNQHAIARRFGIFDNTYTDAQVSASGHTWSTAAFANDYLERFWPVNYGGRRTQYDFEDGAVASVPRSGYLWDNAKRNGITYRDYGEFVAIPALLGIESTQMPGLRGHVDAAYRGFDLTVSDEARVDEWQREFNGFVAQRSLPALEFIRLPNDHTAYTKPGALTPRAYIAQNDHAFGRIVDAVSHSPYWSSTVIFAIEDDAQNGPDHVDAQRTTLYVVSPYARAGVHHAHYSTSAVVHTIELFLGLPAMSIYDAVAPPLYDAFDTAPDMAPFQRLSAQIDVNERNGKNAYAASVSNAFDLHHADVVDPAIANDILQHVRGMRVRR